MELDSIKKSTFVSSYIKHGDDYKNIKSTKVTVIDYSKEGFFEKKEINEEDIEHYKNSSTVTWINVEGLGNIQHVKEICSYFEIDSLLIDDILHVNQRPKIDIHDKYFYTVLRQIYLNQDNDIQNEQISIIVYNNLIITFQESKNNFFEPIKAKIRKTQSNMKNKTGDYLFHEILDLIIDHYISVLTLIDDKIYNLEERFNERIKEDVILEMYNLRKDISIYRKNIKPVKELITFFTREDDENLLINQDNIKYFIDLKDHLNYVIDLLENQKEIMSNLFSLYNMIVSNRMNDVMKTLTIITSIFVPLTFLTGVYGMNFEFLPGIHYKYSFQIFFGVIFLVAVIMITFFISRGWLKYREEN